MSRRSEYVGLLGLLALVGCGLPADRSKADPDSALLAGREAGLAERLSRPDSGPAGRPMAQWKLPPALSEVSGLALTADGQLLAHGDGRGKVFVVDYRRGSIVHEFSLGKPAVKDDFEAITMVGDTVVLLASNGTIYEVADGGRDTTGKFRSYDTGLGDECEFEGLAYDPAIRSLLLACKRVHAKAMRDSVIIYRLPRARDASQEPSHLAVAAQALVGANGKGGWHPSDITVDPSTGNYLLLSSQEQALAEITPAGVVVFSRPLPPGHDQPEGIAITRDSLLIIGDEAKGGSALLTIYRWRH